MQTKGSSAIVSLLESGKLTKFACSYNSLGPVWGSKVLKASMKSLRLDEISLGGNGLTDSCATAVVELLAGHPRLRILHLPHNQLGAIL